MTTYEDIERKYGDAIRAYKKATLIRGNVVPAEVSSEIDNALSHIVVHFKQAEAGETSDEHLKKAEGHLDRAILDSLKVIWLEYWAIFTELVSHPIKSRVRFGNSWKALRGRLRIGLNELYKMSIETRATEIKNVGTKIQDSIDKWEKLIDFIENTVFPENEDLSTEVFAAYRDSVRRSSYLKRWSPEIITFSVGLAVAMIFARLLA